MEQKPQQQTTVVIKEEIADTNCSIKENTITQRAAKSTSKGDKETNETVESSMKIERISSPTRGSNVRGASSPKHTTVSQAASSNPSTTSTILKTALTHIPSTSSRSADELSPPPMTMGTSNLTSDSEQNSMSAKSSLKVKRLLSTLLQFANTLNADAGKTVKTLIFNLACNAITIEEFHSNLQDATNFPLRPFVLPFLKNYIPALQKEISIQAKMSTQNVQQYVRQHENCVLDPFCSSSELSEVFNQTETVSSSNQPEIFFTTLGAKRRYDCLESNVVCHKGDSSTDPQLHTPPPMKKVATSNSYSVITNGSPYAGNTAPNACYANEYFQIPPPPFLSSNNNWLPNVWTSTKDCNSVPDDRKSAGDSEWNNIHVMLNCILSMVEKTKRALTILQERNSHDNCCDLNEGLHLDGVNGEHGSTSRRTNAEDVKRTANELMVHTVRLTEEKIAFVKRKAEEAVNEVKRQAIMELQKAIAATDYKVADHHSATKMTSENKKPIASNAELEFSTHNGFNTSDKTEAAPLFSASQTNNCWNCGRKAQETCSGCNLARYCGSFCQHKDWESHHQICSSYTNSSSTNAEKPSLSRSTYSEPLQRTNGMNDLLNKSSSVDLNILRPQNTSAELYKLLPFSVNVTTVSAEKCITRTTNSRPLTPVSTTSSTISSLVNSKIKK